MSKGYLEAGVYAALGAAAAGSYATGSGFVDVLTSFEGGLGAGVGAALSIPLAMQLFKDKVLKPTSEQGFLKDMEMVMYLSPFVIPAVMTMRLDQGVLAVGAGGAAGLYLGLNYVNPEIN